MKPIKNAFFRNTYFFKQKGFLFFAGFLIVLLRINLFWLSGELDLYGIVLWDFFSVSDYLLSFFTSLYFFPLGVGIFAAILTGSILQNDFSIPVIIRHRSRLRIWFRQTLKLFVFALSVSLFIVGFLLTAGLLFAQNAVNFSEPNSMFQYAMTATTNGRYYPIENPSFVVVLGVVWVTILLNIFIMLLITALSKWLLHNYIFGILCLIVIAAAEQIYAQTTNPNAWQGILYGPSWPNYHKWTDMSSIVFGLLYLLGVAAVLIVAGALAARRKEFLKHGQK